MTVPTTSQLEQALTSLGDMLEESDPRLRSRSEWKEADAWLRSLEPGVDEPSSVEDRLRQAEAHRDLLGIAAIEVRELLRAEERTRVERLAEDEVQLETLQRELKVYGGLILAGFVIPPVLFGPFGSFLLLGLLPTLYGVLRMSSVSSSTSGRAWLILQDRVDQVRTQVRFAHGATLACFAIGGLWLVFALLAAEAAT